MAVDLVDRISTAPRRAYSGHGYRQQSPHYDPLSGEGARIHGGRFNPPNSFPVLYLCSTAGCAAAEFMRTSHRHPLGPTSFLPRSLYRYDVSLTAVLDLTNAPTLVHLGTSLELLVDEDRTLTHQIGEIAHQFGYQAVLNASATGVDDVLAVFIENLRASTVTPVIDSTWESLDDLPVL
jgi:RES domain-containing protein